MREGAPLMGDTRASSHGLYNVKMLRVKMLRVKMLSLLI